MKAEDLRKAILQAAVQGKLVPQDKNDEPASELLKRIQAEKNALIKEGKLKKEKPLRPISDEEIPYDLPDGWVWSKLGDIVELISGQDFSPTGYNDKCDGIPYLTGASNLQASKIIVNRWTTQPRCIAISNDLLIVCKGSGVGKMAVVPVNIPRVHIARQLMAIRSRFSLVLLYIQIATQTMVESLREQMQGVIPGIGRETVLNILFPLPPIAEQQRIVAKVDELMAMCDKLEAAEKELEALEDRFAEYLPKSILQTAVQGKLVPQDKNDEPATELLKRIQKEKVQLVKDGKLKKEKPLPPITEEEIPYDLPDGWVWCRLGDITELIMGQSPDGYNVSNNLGGMEFHQGKSCFTEKYLDVSEVNTTQCTKIAPANSVLLAVRAPVGKVNITRRKVCIGRGLCAIIPLGSMILDFVFYWMQSLEAELVSKATGTTFIAVTGEIVKKQLIPLPPLAEQKRIVSKVNELMTLCEDLKQARIMPIAKVVDRVIPFPATTYKHEPVGMAARGMADDLSAKAMQTIANLFEEED